jgi:octaprenyl-diphosphate synthase
MQLNSIIAPIEEDLDQFEEKLRAILAVDSPLILGVTEHLLGRRGKRLRPALVFLTARATGPLPPGAVLAGMAIELIHTATLLHDDVVDESSTRRGQASVNSKWNNLVSVLMGDYLFSKAFHLLVSVGSPRLMESVSAATEQVSLGELVEIQESHNFEIDESGYLQIIRAKTASLFAAACEAGAILGDSPDPLRISLRDFGGEIGTAFQISDDLLDLVGSQEKTGKMAGNDIKEGRVTLPVIFALKQAPAARRKEFLGLLDNGSGSAHIDEVRSFVTEMGGLDYARERALSIESDARRHLDRLPASQYKDALLELTRFVVSREA